MCGFDVQIHDHLVSGLVSDGIWFAFGKAYISLLVSAQFIKHDKEKHSPLITATR